MTEVSRGNVLDKLIKRAQRKSFNTIHIDNLYLRKCIYTLFFMIRKRMVLTHNYGDTIKLIAEKLEEPITLQYLQTRSRHAKYLSKTSTEYLLDAMNSYYEAHQLKEKKQAPFFYYSRRSRKLFPQRVFFNVYYLLLFT